MKKRTYQVVLTPEPEGGFTVTVPALPGCISYGKTVAEAQFMAADAISCYLASVKKHERDSYTTPSNILLTTVTV
jgi:predicted RNase H-like HicB family nuclease